MPSFTSARTLCAIATLSGLSLTSAASAQAPDIAELQRNPAVRAAINACIADHDRLCSGVTPGGGRIVRCLAAQSAMLSPGCRAAMERASSALMSAGVALMPDRPAK
jgi:hypothetical protein